MPVVDLPAGTVHYEEHGAPEGRPVVFVHGFLVDAGLWSDVPERLAAAGLRAFAPTWPLGAHRTPMHADADLSPLGVARVVRSFLEALDLRDVVLVGNDTGGAICQLLLHDEPEHDARIGALVLTDCDAFETFPPAPFGGLFRMGRHPGVLRAALLGMRSTALRHSPLGFGWLFAHAPAPAVTRPWIEHYVSQAGVRHDVARFCRAWRRDLLVDVSPAMKDVGLPVLICWAPADRFFRISLGRRLAQTFPHARLVEVDDARTFVALDQPARLADEITAFVGGAG